jgi:hypothetical protein
VIVVELAVLSMELAVVVIELAVIVMELVKIFRAFLGKQKIHQSGQIVPH